jgi:hypothetical protein
MMTAISTMANNSKSFKLTLEIKPLFHRMEHAPDQIGCFLVKAFDFFFSQLK